MDDNVKTNSEGIMPSSRDQLDQKTVYLVILPCIACIGFLICWIYCNNWLQYLSCFTEDDMLHNATIPELGLNHQDNLRRRNSRGTWLRSTMWYAIKTAFKNVLLWYIVQMNKNNSWILKSKFRRFIRRIAFVNS